MRTRLHHKLLRRLQIREAWIIFFIMGIIMMNFPFLHIFNKADTIFGFPLFFLYIFIGWAVSIFVIYLFTLSSDHNEPRQRENRKP